MLRNKSLLVGSIAVVIAILGIQFLYWRQSQTEKHEALRQQQHLLNQISLQEQLLEGIQGRIRELQGTGGIPQRLIDVETQMRREAQIRYLRKKEQEAQIQLAILKYQLQEGSK